jgi:hypothetical protein
MVQPRKPRHAKRIIRQAKHESASADLKEYDQLLAERMDRDPSIELSAAEKKQKSARERRLNVLGRRLFKGAR